VVVGALVVAAILVGAPEDAERSSMGNSSTHEWAGWYSDCVADAETVDIKCYFGEGGGRGGDSGEGRRNAGAAFRAVLRSLCPTSSPTRAQGTPFRQVRDPSIAKVMGRPDGIPSALLAFAIDVRSASDRPVMRIGA
jgi:hypothetical protein